MKLQGENKAKIFEIKWIHSDGSCDKAVAAINASGKLRV
jgi:hypothetical protein